MGDENWTVRSKLFFHKQHLGRNFHIFTLLMLSWSFPNRLTSRENHKFV